MQNEFDFASQDASHYMSLRTESTILVSTQSDGYRIDRGKETHQVQKNPWELGYALLGIVHRQAFRDLGDCIRVHAACADYMGSRFIVIGDKGAGKTTLMLRLLFGQEGFQVSGDEMVILEGDRGMPFPRRFHVKTGSVKLLPDIQPFIEKSPGFMIAQPFWLYGFSPAEAGFNWEIVPKKIDAIFFLSPNHAGKTWIEEFTGLQMLKKMMPMSYFSQSDEHFKIEKLCRLVNKVRSYQLHLGNLDNAVGIIQNRLADINQ